MPLVGGYRRRACSEGALVQATGGVQGQLAEQWAAGDEWSVDQAVWRSLICKPHPGYPGSHSRQAEGATWGAATRSPLQAITFPPVSTGSSEGFNRRPTHEPLHPLSSTQPHKPGACIPGAATRKPLPQSTPPNSSHPQATPTPTPTPPITPGTPTPTPQGPHLLVAAGPVLHPVQLILQPSRLLQLVKGGQVAATRLQVLTQPVLQRLRGARGGGCGTGKKRVVEGAVQIRK
jgi:hypothetical protein